MGPTVENRAIVYGELASSADLPIGWTDEQDGGTYRLTRRDDEACFGYNLGPRSWKELRLPPSVTLFRARRNGDGQVVEVEETPEEPVKYAFLGARSCELHAMGILDRVLVGGAHRDRREAARLDDVFVVAVQCGQAGGTCFCASMNTGPRAEQGFDLALTELLPDGNGGGPHRFTVEVGSDAGAAVRRRARPRARARPRPRRRRGDPRAHGRSRWAARCRSTTRTTSSRCSTATTSTRAGRTWRTAA